MADPQPEQQPHEQHQQEMGRRAKLTQDALVVASSKVIKTLDDKAMRQCFPQRWADEYPDLVPGLRDMVVSTYNDGVPLAWNDLVRQAGFVEKANELDRLIVEAQARKDAGGEPRNLMGLDGTITVPSSTVPVLRTSISSLRQKRQALAEENAQAYARIAALSQTVSAREKQNDEILTQFAESVQALKKIDEGGLTALQDELVRVVGNQL
ncbi:mind kinetochore complex component Nnf1 [Rhodotorula toruloides]|uniref:Mind kinetochore complex component Nnf1 n=1 Tax=Rhodotorula toruloides TaxID=5286 RepID=A0A511KKH7_RHOTO|nr:mind kinetochore complex component Nnf1 [Rhodotorula toruloides]